MMNITQCITNYRSLPASLFLGGLMLFSPDLAAQDTVLRSNASLEALARYETQLAELESRHGPYDTSLLEPLQSMERLLMEQGLYERVADLQNRRLQVLRTSLGFEHLDQIPVLEQLVTTSLHLRRWQEVSDHLAHIRHLKAVNHGAESDQVLEAMDQLAAWNLTRIYVDEEADRSDFVLDVREIYDEALDIAEDKWDEESRQLVPWLYRRSLSLYHLVAFMNNDNGLAGRTIDDVIKRDGMARLHTLNRGGTLSSWSISGVGSRTPIVEEGEPVGVAYLRQALGFINDIGDIAEANGDKELQAIAELYHGDYQILMGRSSGRRDYREARRLFIEAGIEAQRVDQFFAVPAPIPLQEFHSDFDSLEAHNKARLAAVSVDEKNPEQEIVHVGLFTAWEEDLPAVALPDKLPPPIQLEIETNAVELDFRVNSRGETSSIDVVQSWPDERDVQRTAWRALRDIRFRPVFSDDRTRTTRNARLRYEFHVVQEQ